MASSLVNNQIYITGGQNFMLGGTLPINEVLSESGFNDNSEAVTTIDVIATTSGDKDADSDAKISFQAYLENGTAIYSSPKVLNTSGTFVKNRTERFTLAGNNVCTIGDLKSFKLSTADTNGWKVKSLIVIVNSKRVIFSDIAVNSWIDGDSKSQKPFLEKHFDKFINPEMNRGKVLNSSNVTVITTTSTDENSQTANDVKIKLGALSAEYKLNNGLTGNFTSGTTAAFFDITKTANISDFDLIQLISTGTDDWKFKSIIVLMNNKIVFYKDNINKWIGTDREETSWTCFALHDNEKDENKESVNSIDVIAVTSGDDLADSDSPVYFQAYLKGGGKLFSGADGTRLDLADFDDFEKNETSRFSFSLNSPCTVADLDSFKLTITDTDGWKIKALIVLVNDRRIVYANSKINTWVDTDNPSVSHTYGRDFDIFTNPVQNRSSVIPNSNVTVITTTSADKDSGTTNAAYINFGTNAAEFAMKNDLTNNHLAGATDAFFDITGTEEITEFNTLKLRVNGADDWKLKAVFVFMNNKIVYYKDNINVWIGKDTNLDWTGDMTDSSIYDEAIKYYAAVI